MTMEQQPAHVLLSSSSSNNQLHVANDECPSVKQPEPVVMVRPPPSPPRRHEDDDDGNGRKFVSGDPKQSSSSFLKDGTCPKDREDTAVAVASALVGENVCDSPTGATRAIFPLSSSSSTKRAYSSYAPTDTANGAGAGGNDNDDHDRDDRITGDGRRLGADAFSRDQVRPAFAFGGGGRGEDESTSGGMIAAGLAWVQRQRQRRRRTELQSQAEQQLRKIVDGERYSDASHNKYAKHSLAENSTYLQLASSSMLPSSLSTTATTTATTATTTTNAITTAAAATTISTKSSLEEEDGTGQRIKIKQGPQLSKSGEGVTGQLDISEIMMEVEDTAWIPKVRWEEEPSSVPPNILSPEQMQQIAIHVLPRTIAYCRWTRLYGLARDGDSFHACLRAIQTTQRTLLVIRTTKGAIFGGYADSPWNSNEHRSNSFYGSAQACLYSFHSSSSTTDTEAATPNNNTTDTMDSTEITNNNQDSPPPQVYRWSGANRYIQLCDIPNKMFAFGGGGEDGTFGLCVQDDFQVGSTGPCDTFQNQPLCDQDHFQIVDLEFWGFLTGQF